MTLGRIPAVVLDYDNRMKSQADMAENTTNTPITKKIIIINATVITITITESTDSGTVRCRQRFVMFRCYTHYS